MTFNAAIPQSTDDPSVSQGQILTNFSQLNTQFSVNHIALTAGADNGKHTFIEMLDQVADPATAVNEMTIYSKDLAGVSTLYMRKESSGTVIQLSAADPTIAANGSSFMAGGIIVKWGGSIINTGPTAVAFVTPFPNAIYSLVLTVGNSATSSQQVVYSNLTQAGFNGYGSTNGLLVTYIAIGN